MLANIHSLLETLNRSGVRYCHWKSNAALPEALCGFTDLDLLVDRQDASVFRSLLAQFSFRPADNLDGGAFPSTEHYFGMDPDTGVLAHIHAYFRVITGESLAKNFHLPVEDMLLHNTRQEGSMKLPTKAAELVVFTIRMMLKHTAFVELAMLARDRHVRQREIAWLVEDNSVAEAERLVAQWLPTLDPGLFTECVAALREPAPVTRRLLLARRLRSSLRIYARRPKIQASWAGFSTFALMLLRRLARAPKGLGPRSGGALVAFIGPEATGKSTLIREVSSWLGQHFAVERVHAGKPNSTVLTALPNALVPLLRLLAPHQRASELEACHPVKPNAPAEWVYPLSFAVRSILLAYDRRVLLTRAFARAANGTVVLCDRYPYIARGSPDGPRLTYYSLPRDRYPIRNMLAALERRLYQQIPRPDLIISLTTPVEIAIARNRTRGKHEPEDYVRRRHAGTSSVPVGHSLVCSIDTNRELDQTLREVKDAIWSVL